MEPFGEATLGETREPDQRLIRATICDAVPVSLAEGAKGSFARAGRTP